MTDLELTKACAEAMGLTVYVDGGDLCWLSRTEARNFSGRGFNYRYSVRYDPLHDDAQRWALLMWLAERGDVTFGQKQFWFRPNVSSDTMLWNSTEYGRALCECVANLKDRP